jgi:hypothetical protein
MPNPAPRVSSCRPQRRWLPAPPGGFPRGKPKSHQPHKQVSERRRREIAAFWRMAPGLSGAAVTVMSVVLVAVVVVFIVALALQA